MEEIKENEKFFIDDTEMKLNLINYDWGDSFMSVSNIHHRKYVDYYVDNIKQSEKVKAEMFAEIENRSAHNIWIVVNYRGTAVTRELCKTLEKELQEKGVSEILFGELRLNELGKKFLETGVEQ